jgi:hypothetical protein
VEAAVAIDDQGGRGDAHPFSQLRFPPRATRGINAERFIQRRNEDSAPVVRGKRHGVADGALAGIAGVAAPRRWKCCHSDIARVRRARRRPSLQRRVADVGGIGST